MIERKDRIKQQRSTVTIILSIAAIVLILSSLLIKNEESSNLIRTIGFGIMLASILFRVFKGNFAYKPTREEIEERMFGKKEKEVEK